MLDALGRELEGAVHRISAASCYEKAGDPSRAVNLYRAALSGPLREDTRQDVENIINACLAILDYPSLESGIYAYRPAGTKFRAVGWVERR